MRKFCYLLLLLAAATGCQAGREGFVTRGELSFRQEVRDYTTKLSTTVTRENGQIYEYVAFEDGDRVGISATHSSASYVNVPYTCSGDMLQSDTPMVFSGQTGSPVRIWAYYPYQRAWPENEEFTVEADQSDIRRFTASDLRTASCEVQLQEKMCANLDFQHALSNLTIRVTGMQEEITEVYIANVGGKATGQKGYWYVTGDRGMVKALNETRSNQIITTSVPTHH